MENIHIKEKEIQTKNNILVCYENLVKNFNKNSDSFIYFYYFLKQLQYEFYNLLTKNKKDTKGGVRPFVICSYENDYEEQYFIFDKNPNSMTIELEINNEKENISFLTFINKYFNIREENFYRAINILDKFIDYEIKTELKPVFRLPKLKAKYQNFSFSKLRLLLKLRDEEIDKLILNNKLSPNLTVKEIEELLKSPKPFKDKGPSLDYDYDHYPLYSLEDFDNFKQNETKFYLHQTYVQYHEEKKEIALLNEMIKILSKKLITEEKDQQKLITETRNLAKKKIKEKNI